MKKVNLLQLWKQSKEEVEESKLNHAYKTTQNRLNQAINDTELALSEKEMEFESSLREQPVDIAKCIRIEAEIEEYKNGLGRLLKFKEDYL